MIIRIKETFVVFLYAALCSLYLFSSVPMTSFAEEKQAKKEVTVITSKTLTADNKAKTALFEGSVEARKGEMTLFSDKMLVYYSEDKGSSNIKKIDAEGHVKLLKEGRVVTAQSANYFAEPEEKAVFTGEPRMTDGENVVTGTIMTYFMKDDRSIVENAKVFMVNKEKK